MPTVIRNIVSYSVLGIGLLIYSCYLYGEHMFVESSIVMMLTLFIWMVATCCLENFNQVIFSRVLGVSGLIFAISVFLFYGVTEVPMPEGAMIFNLAGIATTLFIILLSVLPIVFTVNCCNDASDCCDDTSNTLISPQLKTESQPSPNVDDELDFEIDEGWEIATDEDISSDKFEIAA